MANQRLDELHPGYIQSIQKKIDWVNTQAQKIRDLDKRIGVFQNAAEIMTTSTIQNSWTGRISSFHGLSASDVEGCLSVGLRSEIERLTGLRDNIYHVLNGSIENEALYRAIDHGVMMDGNGREVGCTFG